MSILYFLESIRTPVLNILGTGVTFLGSETFLLIVLAVTYWCCDKDLGYRLAFSYTIAGSVNCALKIGFRVPRPWVKDPSFTTVSGAQSDAAGYSFPSGHSNNIGVIGTTFFLGTKSVVIKIIAIALMVLVPVSRMYLGVHTLADVCVGLGLAIIISLIVNCVMARTLVDKKSLSPIMFAMLIVPAALLIFALAMYYNGLVDYDNMADSIKSSGAFFGFIIGWYIEKTKINFNVRCSKLWKQAVKLVIGFAVVLAIKSGLKEVFLLIGDEFWPGDFIRYFLMTFFAMGIYPWFIKKFFSSKVPYRRSLM